MVHVFNLNGRYNFTPIQRYKTLDAEEAEEEIDDPADEGVEEERKLLRC